MAPLANLGRVGSQQLPVGRCMGIVAACTVPCLYRCVQEWTFQFVFKVDVAGQTDLPFAAGLQLKLVLLGSMSPGNNKKRTRNI